MPTDEEIRLRLLVEAQQLFKAVDDSIVRVRLLEDSFKTLSSKGKEYLARLADELKAINKAKVETAANLQIAALPGTAKEKKQPTKEIMAAARKEIADYNRDVETALQNTLNYEKVVAEVLKNNVKTLNEAKQIKFDVKDFPIVKNLQAAQAQVKNLQQIISQYSAQSGASFREVGKEILAQAKAAGMAGQQYKQLQQNVNAAVTGLNKMTTAGKAFAGVGKLIQNAFSFFLGGSIFMAISRLINGFNELVKSGEEYAQTIYRLGVSINQLQRRGLDITIKSEIALIKELRAEYQTFSQRGIIEATTAVQMLTRNFGFSQEQIKKTIQLSMDLALVQGKDVGETAKQLALFYSSGYGEGLQHAGLAVNRLTVLNEAHRMGIKKSYMELTEIERATAAYNLVTRQSIDLHQDAMKIQDNIIGQIKEQKAGIEDVTNEIALRALPIELAWLKVKLAFVRVLGDQIDRQDAYWESVRKVAESQGKVFDEMKFGDQQKFLQNNREAIMKGMDELVKQGKDEFEKMMEGIFDTKVDPNIDLSSAEDKLAEDRAKIGELIIDLYSDLEDIQADYNDKSAELEKEHGEKLVEIANDTADKLRDIWSKLKEAQAEAQQEYNDKIADIAAELEQEIADKYTDYYRELEDIDIEYRRSVQDANRKYHENEVKAERDYQEKMRRLREEYLFDLEDALRERDALQILRLMRRYALDKQQAERENQQGKQDRSEAYRQELEDLRRQTEQKRQDAQRALQQEIADANLAAQRKREDAQKALDEQLADAQEAYNKARDQALADQAARKAEEDAAYAERQTALDKDIQDRRDKLQTAFAQELVDMGVSLEDVNKLVTKYFGDKGLTNAEIDKFIDKYTESANSMMTNELLMEGYIANLNATVATNVAAINASLATLNWSALGPMQQVNQQYPTGAGLNPMQQVNQMPKIPGKASGASNWMLTRPQLFMAGEVPERLDITPVSQLNSNKLGGTNGKNGNGKGQIEISLGKDLEGRIIDNTLSEFDVILTREMSRK